MKVLSFFAGLALLSLSIVLVGWLVVTTNFFSITTISCTNNKKECPQEIQEQLKNALLSKSLLITDFNKELHATNIAITSFSKQIPGLLTVEVAAKAENQSERNIDVSQVEEVVKTTFEEQSFSVSEILISERDNYVVTTIENLQIILSFDNLEADLEKAVIILTNLDLNTIDLDITEIDTRYKLPVLRTTKTTF